MLLSSGFRHGRATAWGSNNRWPSWPVLGGGRTPQAWWRILELLGALFFPWSSHPPYRTLWEFPELLWSCFPPHRDCLGSVSSLSLTLCFGNGCWAFPCLFLHLPLLLCQPLLHLHPRWHRPFLSQASDVSTLVSGQHHLVDFGLTMSYCHPVW